MLGAYITYFCFTLFGIDPIISLLISGIITFILGILIYMGIFNRLFRKSKTVDELVFRGLIASFGLSFVIQNTAMLLWTSTPKGPVPYYRFPINIGGTMFAANRIIIAVATLIINAILYIFLSYTRFGLVMRATVEEPVGAQLVGANIFKVHLFSFALGTLLSALTGTFLCTLYPISPFIGPPYVTIALTVMLIGGVGSFVGSIAGGMLLGLSSYITMRVIHPSLTLVIVYAFLVIVLLVKPEGLFRR